MARKRLSMRKIKEILRLKWESGLSVRGIAGACSVGRETVREYLRRASEAGLSWPLPEGMADTDLECLLFPSVGILTYRDRKHPDWANVYQELTRKGITRKLLWTEYCEAEDNPYGYSQFCELYSRWTKHLNPVLRLHHNM